MICFSDQQKYVTSQQRETVQVKEKVLLNGAIGCQHYSLWRRGYGAFVEWCQSNAKVLGEHHIPVLFCPPQISRWLSWDLTLASAVRGRRITPWSTTGPRFAGHDVGVTFWVSYRVVRIIQLIRFAPSSCASVKKQLLKRQVHREQNVVHFRINYKSGILWP